MPPKPIPQTNFVRGLVAVANPLLQPKGSVPRMSNLLLSERGSLVTCDGSQILAAYNGSTSYSRGRVVASFLFQPSNVSPYYLVLARDPSAPLGQVRNVSATLYGGGGLTSGQTYYYYVTALDAIGGETAVSSEVSATPSGTNLSIRVQWQGIPNAAYYMLYRGTSSGAEQPLMGLYCPVMQPSYPPQVLGLTDDGTSNYPASTGRTITYYVSSTQSFPWGYESSVQITLSNPLVFWSSGNISYSIGPKRGQRITITGASPSALNGTWPVIATTASATQFTILTTTNVGNGSGNPGGTAAAAAFPTTDTTQQLALYSVPFASTGLPVSYNESNALAFFPADPSLIPVQGVYIP